MRMSKAMGFTGVLLPCGRYTPDPAGCSTWGRPPSYLTQSHYQGHFQWMTPADSEILIGSKIALSNISQEDWAIIRKWQEKRQSTKSTMVRDGRKGKERLIEEGADH